MKPEKPAPAALLTRKLIRLLPALFLLLSLPVGKSAAHSAHHQVAAQPDLRLPDNKTLGLWYQDNHHHLSRNPYHRKRNELVANILLEQFEANPASWEAIAYLNPSAEKANLVFKHYLSAWRDACPDELKEVVEQIIASFGQTPDNSRQRTAQAPES